MTRQRTLAGRLGHLRRSGGSRGDHALRAGRLRARGDFFRQCRHVRQRQCRSGCRQGDQGPAAHRPRTLNQSLLRGQQEPERARPFAKAHLRIDSRLTQAPGHRLRRPILLPSFRRRDAGGRDGACYERPSAPGQGAVLGHQRMDRNTDRLGPRPGSRDRRRSAHDGTAAIQPIPSRAGRARPHVGVRDAGHRAHHMEPDWPLDCSPASTTTASRRARAPRCRVTNGCARKR